MQNQTLVELFKEELDHGDLWGSATMWLFYIADNLAKRGEEIPDEWGFKLGAAGPDDERAADLNPIPADDLRRFGSFLDRWRARLDAQGFSY